MSGQEEMSESGTMKGPTSSRTPPSEAGSTLSAQAAMLISSLRIKDEVHFINHKTKVSQVNPPGRVLYEWEWDIPKFDKVFPFTSGTLTGIINEKTKVIKSEKIVAGTEIGKKCKWHFQLSEYNGKLNWNIVLDKIYKPTSNWIHAAYQLTVVDAQGRELIPKKRCFREFQENIMFGCDDLITLDALCEQKENYLSDNTFRTRVAFEMYITPERWAVDARKQEKEDFAKLMTTDLYRLRTATGTADVHLECEGKVFPVHKLILSARSGTFSKMFDTPIVSNKFLKCHPHNSATAGGDLPPDTEHSVGSVSISDVDPNILDIVLDYIYSGQVKSLDNPDMLAKTIIAADKYDLVDLKAYCFNSLMKFVSEENIGTIAVLAHRHNAERVVRKNIDGMCLRNLGSLMRRKSFRNALKTEPDAFFPDDEALESR